MAKKRLRHGYSTGACAAAAAKGATMALLGAPVDEVSLKLPWKRETATFRSFKLVGLTKDTEVSSCGVIKDGGDDPDVTNGMEIRAAVSLISGVKASSSGGFTVEIEGGEGVGRVTRKGLAAEVGSPAINPVPLEMIEESVREAVSLQKVDGISGVRVVISAPEGAERAKKTLNHRLGIVGGLSILGTTGIVIPMSAAAWEATIDSCLDVAKAAGAKRMLLAFGRTSELAGHKLYPELAENAAVLMGDHVGYSLDQTVKRDLDAVIVGQFAKFCKVAGGHYRTHVKDSSLDLTVLKELMEEAGFPTAEAKEALKANTARQIYENLRETGDRGLFELLTCRVARRAQERVEGAIAIETVLFGYKGEELARCSFERGASV